MPEFNQQDREFGQIEREYKREVTLVEAKPKLRRAGLILWIAVDAILLLIFVGYIGYYLIYGSFLDRQEVTSMAANVASLHAFSISRSAQKPLAIDDTRVFTSETGYYDFYADVENQNQDWYAQFTYHFVSSLGETENKSGFILPGETRPLVMLHAGFETRPVNAELVIDNLKWFRVDAHKIENIESWLIEHQKFEITNSVFETDVQIQNKQFARSSFTIKNNTPYSYWSPEFIVILERSGVPAAVNQTTIAGFETGETRNIDINWFGTTPITAEVVVIPNINYFDPEVYKSLPVAPPTDIRD